MTTNVNPITHTELVEQMRVALDLALPFVIWGEPGIGKSSIVEQAAILRGMKCTPVHLTQMSPQDIFGILFPDTKTGTTVQYAPQFLPGINDEPTILFFDEIGAAPEQVRKPATQIILERRLGSYVLAPQHLIVAASNTGEDGTLTHEMDRATADRLIHFKIIPKFDHWRDVYASAAKIDLRVIHFLASNTQYFCASMFEAAFPDKTGNADLQQIVPTPRSWSRVSRIIQDVMDPEERKPLIEGSLGIATTIQFLRHTSLDKNTITARTILDAKPKDRAKMLPNSGPEVMALATSLASNCTNSLKDHIAGMNIAGLISEHKVTASSKKTGNWQNMGTIELGSCAADMICKHAKEMGGEDFLEKIIKSPDSEPGTSILISNPFEGKKDPKAKKMVDDMDPGSALMAAIAKQSAGAIQKQDNMNIVNINQNKQRKAA